jgi:hypothetical protein
MLICMGPAIVSLLSYFGTNLIVQLTLQKDIVNPDHQWQTPPASLNHNARVQQGALCRDPTTTKVHF